VRAALGGADRVDKADLRGRQVRVGGCGLCVGSVCMFVWQPASAALRSSSLSWLSAQGPGQLRPCRFEGPPCAAARQPRAAGGSRPPPAAAPPPASHVLRVAAAARRCFHLLPAAACSPQPPQRAPSVRAPAGTGRRLR
jgi:hypothetical protein